MGRRVNVTGIAVLVFFLLLGILISMRLTGLGRQFLNPVGGALQRALSPVENALLQVGTLVRDDTRAFWSFDAVQKENAALKGKVDQLTGDNLKLKQQVLAGMRYAELDQGVFRSPTLDKFKMLGATIINRNPTAWYQTLTINRGSDDGIRVDAPVIAHLGLVGKVIAVTPKTSEVLLITDGEGQVSALVRGSSGEGTFGIVQGTYQRGSRLTASGHLQMLFRRDDNVNAGDLVLTSGWGGVYPKDIPVGKVTEVQLDKSGLLKTAYIEPLVNFDNLEEVYILKMS
ncbi:MAG: rod shape-determining protein MreC [Desulfitobacteriaceae bacterium]|nr:rod shape-determining protein MreC [Desulfitobacteriaceae bacterium]MDI6878690.1 rod shape-determining protein MreC [Desulfitobacteriaceae bacterium]MDI6914127.1 rod shape-determining protein MreC [Desulfitobacteriaceae bacterium]